MISRAHRRRLNRAMHELRRPLQALALAEDAEGPRAEAPARRGLLELACGALAELDGVVNGGDVPASRRPVRGRELVHAALERWRSAAEDAGGIRVFWDAGEAPLVGDPVRLTRALDNLIANALEHGGPPLVVTGADVAGRLRLTVANGAPEDASPRDGASNGDGRRRDAPDPRRGHGIAVVSEIASEHRGRFALCRTGSGCVAALELPLTDESLARAA